MMVKRLLYPASLQLTSPTDLSSSSASVAAAATKNLSIMSYNILLPNSIDGWWNYKMYNPPLSDEMEHVGTWDYRSNLLKNKIETMNPDVICFQEVSPKSFDMDFAFMKDLGYDQNEMHRKGRFRPATFWKSSKLELVCDPLHKDRTLLTTFKIIQENDDNKNNNKEHWHVLNVHLQAGNNGPRRVRQIDEAIKTVFKTAKNKLKESDPTNPILVVCGDFNGGHECGAVRYLEDGEITPEFMEDNMPVTSRVKKMPLEKPLVDVFYGDQTISEDEKNEQKNNKDEEEYPTMIVSELISQLVDPASPEENPQLSSSVIQSLEEIYDTKYATHSSSETKLMNVENVEQWLIDINKQLNRGSEFRTAAKQMGWEAPPDEENPRYFLPKDSYLTKEGFKNVYQDELRQGKFWGIAYDLAVMGKPLPDKGLYGARFDRMYFSQGRIEPYCTIQTKLDDGGDESKTKSCPNDVEPSDHLPISATFTIRQS